MNRIPGHLVHKVVPANVLLAWVRESANEDDCYEAEMVMDVAHPFFFEHQLDHIPAMMLVEAGRQMGIAVSHLFLGVPRGTMFATESFDIRFTNFAELSPAVTIRARVTDRRYRKGYLVHLRLDGDFSQGGSRLGGMGGTWVMLEPAVWKRHRRRERARLLP